MPGAVDDNDDDGNDDEGIFFDFKKTLFCTIGGQKNYCISERKNVFYAITACMTPGDFFFYKVFLTLLHPRTPY